MLNLSVPIKCVAVLVVDMSHVYHQHSMHFISYLCLSHAKCFILMNSTSFDEFVREGAHRRNLRAFGPSRRPAGHNLSFRPPTWPNCHVTDPGARKHTYLRS